MLGNSQYAIEKGCWIKADTNLKSLQGKAKLRGQKIEKQGKGKQGKGLRGASQKRAGKKAVQIEANN
eukprot:scaffold85010_cov13-Tisochrysis_lutea.AAC.1